MKNIAPVLLIAASLLFMLMPVPALADDGDIPVLRVGHVGHDHQLALYVGAEAGQSIESKYGAYMKQVKAQEVYDLFDKGRLVARLQMVRVGGGSKMPAALEQGHIDVGLGGLGPVAKFYDKGSDLKVLAPLNNDGDALVMKKGYGVADWKGFVQRVKSSDKPIKIGYKAPMAVAFMILTRALEEEGIPFGHEVLTADGSINKVILVNLQGLKNALPSLVAGLVDGVVVNEPMVSILVHKGVGERVADLTMLPPAGKWEGHPCCVVATRLDALNQKRSIIVSFLKVIAAGGDIIAENKGKALEAESRWTRTSPEVGINSIDNVSYVVAPDAQWLEGVDTWIELMSTSRHFKKRLKGKSAAEIKDNILELGPMTEALTSIGSKR